MDMNTTNITAKLGTETGSLINHLMSGSKGEPEPVVGMGVTFLYWTDRSAGTIVEVNQQKRYIAVTGDRAIRVDNNGMSDAQGYTYETLPDAPRSYFRKTKKGEWVQHVFNENGRLVMARGTRLAIGYRDAYHDYSF